jgi:endonuclease-8
MHGDPPVPEGDSILHLARTLHDALAGRNVSRFESNLPALTRVDVDRPLSGRTVESAVARGKHLLITFSGDLILHTHLRMHGAWHLYRPNEPWRRPVRDMRVVIEAGSAVAVGFNLPVAEFLTARSLARHDRLRALGPDLADPAFDSAEAVRRMRERGHLSAGATSIGDLLLDQRVIAGIGNVLKSEILFVAGIYPFRATGDLSDARLQQLIEVARRLMRMNTAPLQMAFGRRTRNSLDPRARLWVYGRAGKPCRRCGAAIESRKTGLDARITYWCPGCQPESSATSALSP